MTTLFNWTDFGNDMFIGEEPKQSSRRTESPAQYAAHKARARERWGALTPEQRKERNKDKYAIKKRSK